MRILSLPFLVFGLSAFCSAQVKNDKTPNIILIFPDQLRSDYVGAKGGKWVYTPNMDRLANEGAVFTRAYSATPTCLPARAALLTGKKPWKHGLLAYAPMATKYSNEMPRLLRDAGYYTFATGKLHFKPIGAGPLNVELGAIDNAKFMHGFHEIALCEGWGHPQNAYNKWFKDKAPDKNIDGTGLGPTDHRAGVYPYGEELHPTTWTANQAIDFISGYNRNAPYFLKVAFHRPHPPFDPPKRWLDFYKKRDLPLAAVGDWADEKYGGFNKVPDIGEQQNSPRGNYGDSVVRRSREAYLASISFMDEQIGKILRALEESGELENTLILISSDHGDMMGDHHLWRKSYPYEGSSSVPMIVRWPESIGIEADRGQVIENLVELRDVLPTFLEVAQISPPTDLDGLSLLNLIKGERDNWRKTLDLEHGTCYWPENNWTGLTDAQYKYIYFATTGEEQLFDLEQDPKEMCDLAKKKEYKNTLQKWRRKMVDHLAERGEPWVVNGELGLRTEEIKFSPNYPKEYYPREIVTKY
ncbi:arylsulfatase [Pseudozobellia thermophila]|nr:arylsulfatase [Pseudozobellia thermophila]